jgi:hypothetical protein
VFRAKAVPSFVSRAVLVAALALLSIGPAQAASLGDNAQIAATPSLRAEVTTKADASVTAKCRKATKKVNEAKKAVKKAKRRLKKARSSGNKAKIRRAKRSLKQARTRLKKANEAKKRACKAAPTPPTSTTNHPPEIPNPLTFDDIDFVKYAIHAGGYTVGTATRVTLVHPAVDPDGDPLTYAWSVEFGEITEVLDGGLKVVWRNEAHYGPQGTYVTKTKAHLTVTDGKGGEAKTVTPEL